ncbi:MFS transporter [Actinoallomurus rhizosphaericola]|uniref:MFS transporter n=1 Tax=Actinoallomurus rhizosphaericola TaxID=2952536 RepID=UPI0020920DEF|nr:MFS transporter [Actinoallomurus rhizosphaericola]MCO5999634.1 MFS transporter [Actinoallomurus rhizosphaericola]
MRKWWPLVAVCLGAFMLLVDVTIVTVALPGMARSLHASFSALQWVLDIYALALAALLLGAGSVADLFGARRVYVAGLVLFAAASLACGLAPNAATLIAARGVQGVGGAAMFTTTLALLNSTYQGRDRGVAFGVWGAVNGLAAAGGPILGGLLTQHVNWRSIFLVNLPVTVIAIVLTLAVVGESRRTGRARIDLPGMTSFTACAGALTYGLIRAGDDGFTAATPLTMFALAAVTLAVFVVVERRTPHPLLDLGLFRNRSFVAVLIAGALLMASAFACLAFTSLWLQGTLGLGPVRAGAALIPLALASFLVSAAGARLLHGVPPRLSIGIGLLLIGAGSGLQAVLDAGSTSTAIIPGLIVGGVGVGAAIPVLSAAAMGAVPPERGGMAGGALNTFRQLGYALGIAVLGIVFRGRIEHVLTGHVADPHAMAGAASGGQAPRLPIVRAAVASGLNEVYAVSAGLGIAAGIVVLALVRPPRRTVRPEPRREKAAA